MAMMTGAEAGRKILPFGPEEKIVFIIADEHTGEESMKAGAVDFI
jgi:FixJ family two-component response regulator